MGESLARGRMNPARVGILALQGDVREHVETLDRIGAEPVEVRTAEGLTGIDGLIIPGGESTAIAYLLRTYGMEEPLLDLLARGMPALGLCAGLITLATTRPEGTDGLAAEGKPGQGAAGKGAIGDGTPGLGVMDVFLERNAYGRQTASFSSSVTVEGLEAPFSAVFIRAPQIRKYGERVSVLARLRSEVVGVRQGNLFGLAFHPELSGDDRIHRLFLHAVEEHAAEGALP